MNATRIAARHLSSARRVLLAEALKLAKSDDDLGRGAVVLAIMKTIAQAEGYLDRLDRLETTVGRSLAEAKNPRRKQKRRPSPSNPQPENEANGQNNTPALYGAEGQR